MGLSQEGTLSGSLYLSHESDERTMGSNGIDYEGILTPDSEDVCSRCWDFQLDVSTSNSKNSVKMLSLQTLLLQLLNTG